VRMRSPSRSTAAVSCCAAPNSRGWRAVACEVAADRLDRLVFAVTALLVGLGYSLLLPFAFTQRISFVNWDYLDARYVLFSVAFALALGWLMTLQVHAVRRVAGNAGGERSAGRTGPLGAIAAVLSVLPSLLCCSPILPTLVGLIGLSATTRLTTTVQLQHFFATQENVLLAGALGLLVLSGLWSMRKLSRAVCLTGDRCSPALAGRPAHSPSRSESPTARASPR
jgi:hypothetical protein